MAHLSLFALPSELLTQIVRLLDYHDRTQLNATCTYLNNIVEPLIWANIEFHALGFHKSPHELDDPPPHIPASQRPYQHRRQTVQFGDLVVPQARRFVLLLLGYYKTDQSRLKRICSRVRSLCIGIESSCSGWNLNDGMEPDAFWPTLPFFTNLVTLEIHAADKDEGYSITKLSAADIESPPLETLRFVKLCGYIPPNVVQWVLKRGTLVERLELGLLDVPVPGSEETLSLNHNFNEDFGVDAVSNDGSLCAWKVIPRPLGGVLLDNTVEELPNLKMLYLCSPADAPQTSIRDLCEYSFSSRAETSSLSDWKKLLISSDQSLETLVLEHRPGAEYIEGGGPSPQEYVAYNKDGRIDAVLVEMIETLLARTGSFPLLECVYLYGFAVGEDPDESPDGDTPGGRLMNTLKARGVRCEARRGTWCYFEGDSGCAVWCDWEEDESDGHPDLSEGLRVFSDDDSFVEFRETWDTLLAEV